MIARVLQVVTVVVAVLALVSWVIPREGARPPGPSGATNVQAPSAAPTLVLVMPSPTVPSSNPLPPLETLRISIPELGIDLPLAYGDIARDVPQGRYDGNTPERLALVFPGSAALATGGNTYIYAHARVGMFLSLWSVRVNDVVVIYSPDHPEIRLRYTVRRIVPRVDPSDTSWLDPGGPERVTLQTSTGPNAADPRFIAVAVRDAEAPAGSVKP